MTMGRGREGSGTWHARYAIQWSFNDGS